VDDWLGDAVFCAAVEPTIPTKNEDWLDVRFCAVSEDDRAVDEADDPTGWVCWSALTTRGRTTLPIAPLVWAAVVV
jgi:hypothetical protein